MSKEVSIMLKGIAILLMLFLHLFNNLDNAMVCNNLLMIDGVPLTYILTRAAGPVPFYIILSGYGMYLIEHKRKYDVVIKLKKLYLHYWISLFFLIPIGAYMFGMDKYPGSISAVLSNMAGYHTTWNATICFLLPYALLALASKQIWRIFDSVNVYAFIVITLMLNIVCSYVISRFGTVFLYANSWAYIPVLFLQMLFPFSLGACLVRYPWIISKCKMGGVNWIILLVLTICHCCIVTGAFDNFYVLAFIILFVNAPRPKLLERFLFEVGKRSTSMWFIHAYFYGMYFHDFIYSFKYPLLIYIVLIVVSYVSAIVVDKINSIVQKVIFK